jgi:hypothetical protein
MPGNHEQAASILSASWNVPPSSILKAALSPFLGYRTVVDLLILGLFAVLAIYAYWAGRVEVHLGLLAVVVLMLLAIPLIPNTTSQGGWTDRRLPIMAALTLMAAVNCSFAKRSSANIYSIAVVLILALKSDWIALNFAAADKLTEATYQALSSARLGSRILPLQNTPTDSEIAADPLGRFIYKTEATYRHLPVMAIMWRHAFVPTLFSQKGVHPVAVRSPWNTISDSEGGDLLSVSMLSNTSAAPRSATYLRTWKSSFDYVLLLNADYPDRNLSPVLPVELKLLRNTGFAKLYMIVRSPPHL